MVGAKPVTGPRGAKLQRDQAGVVHVEATDVASAMAGLGYAHAYDRGMQMLLVRMIGRGEAAAVLGGDLTTTDVFFKRHGLALDAHEEAAKLERHHADALAAYLEGVNAGFNARVPWELRAIGYRHTPFTAADVVLTSRVIAFVGLAQTQGDMERLIVDLVQAGVSREHVEAMFPGRLEGLDVELVKQVRVPESRVPEFLRDGALVPHATASNNWAIAGDKTASGRALLASDPHLEVNRLPAAWYEAALAWGDRYVVGATMPGLPGVIIGRSNEAAWAPTYAYMDAMDAWIEEVRDGMYRRDGPHGPTWHPVRSRTETVRVKGGADVTVTVNETDHGVLAGDTTPDGYELASMWAPARACGARSLAATLDLLTATSADQAADLLGGLETAWTWVTADARGSVATQMSGLLPDRRPGWSGLVPVPGWDPENAWRGFVAPEDLPRERDPPRGFVSSANEDRNALGNRDASSLPMGSYRADRIADTIAARDDWDVAGAQALQLDTFSRQAALYLPTLRPLLPATPQGQAIAAWDGHYGLDSEGAAMFEAWYERLLVDVLSPVLSERLVTFLLQETGVFNGFYAQFDRILLDADNVWYGKRARDDVWRDVAARLDVPVAPWRSRRTVTMKHLLFGARLPRIFGFDHGPVTLRGSRATPHQSQVFRQSGRDVAFGPSYRFVTDFVEDGAHTVLAGGPSERAFSKWYTSDVDAWQRGLLKRLVADAASSGRQSH